MNAGQQFTEHELAEARGRWDIVGAAVALRPNGRELVGLCPFHNEKSPSFTVVPGKGFYKCFGCGAHGTVIDFVMRHHGLGFVDAVREILGMPRQRARSAPVKAPAAVAGGAGDDDQHESIAKVLDGCGPVVGGTAANLYLAMRCLRPDPRLFAHPELYCSELRRALPALVAPLTDQHGEVTAIQRIWLVDRVEFDGTRDPKDNRAPLRTRKKTLGTMGSSSVMLGGEINRRLGLAEGVETALAASRLFRMPVWATCGVHRLGFPGHYREVGATDPAMWIAPARPPHGIETRWIEPRPPSIWVPPDKGIEIFIFADNGWVGEVIAEHALRHFIEAGHPATVRFPEGRFSDWNDELIDRLALPAASASA